MHFNLIFSGAGLAGLMTLIKMADSGLLVNKTVLIIEPNPKSENDRTWCFWEKSNSTWDSILTHKWEKAFFVNEDEKIECLEGVYSYKMIESKSFYEYAKEKIEPFAVKWVEEKVISFEEVSNQVLVKTLSSEYTGEYLFNSVLDFSVIKNNSSYPLLQQHFVGWFIKTKDSFFNATEAIFMDFSVEQKGNTRFMYVLPKSETEALIEYTLFSPDLLSEDEYEKEIISYLKLKKISQYEILSKEKGNIPMTTFPFWKSNSRRILNIGSAGGWTKASTGYTFKNSDKETSKIIQYLLKDGVDFSDFKRSTKFTFYDDLFVDVLYHNNYIGNEIFSKMFLNCKNELIFKFLDEETSILEDLKVIWSCPKKPFIQSLFRRMIK